jgi:hypothetical protein
MSTTDLNDVEDVDDLLGPPPADDETPIAVELLCSVCHAPQFTSPHGITCKNGHGGAESLPSPASQPRSGSKSGYEGIIFDIETGPLPLADIFKVVPPFDPSTLKPFPPFDESLVKTGNLKDAAKIAEKIEQARAQHAVDAVEHAKSNLAAEGLYVGEVLSKAALSPLTGRVLAIGYYHTEGEELEVDVVGQLIGDGHPFDEKSIISRFWFNYEAAPEHCRIVGHNILGFDLPFLIQRSWMLNIEVPRGVMNGRFFAPKFVDTMAVWACGKAGSAGMTKLDTLAKAFGVGMKNGNGAMFAELLEKDRNAAIEYLKNDVAMTYEVARRMGVCK